MWSKLIRKCPNDCFCLSTRQIWHTQQNKDISWPLSVDQSESDYFINDYPCSLLLLGPACFRLLVAREVFARPPVFVVTTRPRLGNLLHNLGFMSRKWCSLTSFRRSVFNPFFFNFYFKWLGNSEFVKCNLDPPSFSSPWYFYQQAGSWSPQSRLKLPPIQTRCRRGRTRSRSGWKISCFWNWYER